MHRRMMLAALLAAARPAAANDTTAELTTGGLILSRSDAVEMVSEDLFISPEKVTVDYVFRNRYPHMYETRLAYILRTGGNWATGHIGAFRLTVDKGDRQALVSFCGDNVRKSGSTTFEMAAKDFQPERNLHVLILKAYEQARDAAGKPERKRQR